MENKTTELPKTTASKSAVLFGRKGISGSTLKLIAIITMLFDHTGAIVLERFLLQWQSGVDMNGIAVTASQYQSLYVIYWVCRFVLGRIAFPIFCFLIVEGFVHTRNVKKYAFRLFLFALLSEIPFDLGFSGMLVDVTGQNVFFTLLFGLLTIAGMQYMEKKENISKIVRFFSQVIVLAAGMAAAYFLQTDYNMFGVLTVVLMYKLRYNRFLQSGAGCLELALMSSTEYGAFLAMIPLNFYNGKKGWNIKWLFYLFYPLHILLLYLLACMLGVAPLPVM